MQDILYHLLPKFSLDLTCRYSPELLEFVTIFIRDSARGSRDTLNCTIDVNEVELRRARAARAVFTEAATRGTPTCLLQAIVHGLACATFLEIMRDEFTATDILKPRCKRLGWKFGL